VYPKYNYDVWKKIHNEPPERMNDMTSFTQRVVFLSIPFYLAVVLFAYAGYGLNSEYGTYTAAAIIGIGLVVWTVILLIALDPGGDSRR